MRVDHWSGCLFSGVCGKVLLVEGHGPMSAGYKIDLLLNKAKSISSIGRISVIRYLRKSKKMVSKSCGGKKWEKWEKQLCRHQGDHGEAPLQSVKSTVEQRCPCSLWRTLCQTKQRCCGGRSSEGSWQGIHAGVPGELTLWKGIHAGMVLEELQSEGQTHAGVAHVELFSAGLG